MILPQCAESVFNPYNAEIFLNNYAEPYRPKFDLQSSSMCWLALSDSFEYLCYGSTVIISVVFQFGDHFGAYKDGPRAERVNNINWAFSFT